jgi:TolB-like protein
MSAPLPNTIPQKSVAVLPFMDMSEKKDQEYFSDGLSEELIDLLSRLTDLRVPARTSSFFFKGKSDDVAAIAQRLRVAHVLEGSVRKAGDTIRVTAQLIRADNGYHVWSETYDRDLKDVFAVQDEIAGAVVAALKLKLAPGEQATNAHRTSNPEAYNQYLLGRQFSQRATPEFNRRALQAFKKAIELDPGYAPAYAELAVSESDVADDIGDGAGLQRAFIAANRAVTLAPDKVDGYAVRGYLRNVYSWDWTGANTDFRKGLTIDPGNSRVQHDYARLLASFGRLPEAIAATRRALDLDPFSPGTWADLGRFLMRAGQFEPARNALHRALEIEPESMFTQFALATSELLEGRHQKALASFRGVKSDYLRLCGIAIAEHTLGQPAESQRALDELITENAQSGAVQIADVYAWRGEKDKAFEWLERAYQQHDGGLASIKIDEFLVSLQGDPRLTALLHKLQLPE